MTVYELLKINESLLKAMDGIGMKVGDVRYLDAYARFIELRKESGKATYAAEKTADEFGISVSSLWAVIRRFSAKI